MDIFTGFCIVAVVAIVGYLIYMIKDNTNVTKEYMADSEKERDKLQLKIKELEYKIMELKVENSKLQVGMNGDEKVLEETTTIYEEEYFPKATAKRKNKDKIGDIKYGRPVSKCNSKSKK